MRVNSCCPFHRLAQIWTSAVCLQTEALLLQLCDGPHPSLNYNIISGYLDGRLAVIRLACQYSYFLSHLSVSMGLSVGIGKSNYLSLQRWLKMFFWNLWAMPVVRTGGRVRRACQVYFLCLMRIRTVFRIRLSADQKQLGYQAILCGQCDRRLPGNHGISE